MKVSVCDVCLKTQGRYEPAKYRIKYGVAKLETCFEHKDFFLPYETEKDALRAAAELNDKDAGGGR